MSEGIAIPVSVTDNLTGTFNSMIASVEQLTRTFNELQRTGTKAFSPTNPQSMIPPIEEVKRTTQQMTERHIKYNNEIQKSEGLLSTVKSKAKLVLGAYLGFQALKSFVGMADSMASLDVRLDLMNDKLQTTDKLNQMIFQSAQATRSSYMDTAQVISKLGTLAGSAFKNNSELVGFATLMNKSFKLSGASIQEETAAMYQLTQAMASGRLQGDEFRSILENAPMLAQAIQKELNGIDMKKASSEGLITADVIKKAMFNAADDINKKFDEMPRTFAETVTILKNNVMQALAPMARSISQIWQNKYVTQAIAGVSMAIAFLGQIGAGVFNFINGAITFLGDNMGILAPIILGVVSAMVALKVVTIANNIALLASNGLLGIKILDLLTFGAAHIYAAASTAAATMAQWGFNSALFACPITWIILAIIAVIALIFIVIGCIHRVTGTHISAIGVIVGSLYAFVTIVLNILKFIANIFIGTAETIVNAWLHLVYNIKKALVTIQNAAAKVGKAVVGCFDAVANGVGNAFIWAANKAISAINWIIDALNHIPGIDIGKVGEFAAINVHHSTTGFDNFIKANNAWLESQKPKDVHFKEFTYGNVAQSYNKGYKMGEGFSKGMGEKINSVKDMFDPNKMKTSNNELLKGLQNKMKPNGNSGIPIPTSGKNSGLSKHLKGIKDNTKKTADNTSKQSFDVKYLREFAERQAINRFTTAEIHIENTINEAQTQDLDGFVDKLSDKMQQQLEIQVEGYYK